MATDRYKFSESGAARGTGRFYATWIAAVCLAGCGRIGVEQLVIDANVPSTGDDSASAGELSSGTSTETGDTPDTGTSTGAGTGVVVSTDSGAVTGTSSAMDTGSGSDNDSTVNSDSTPGFGTDTEISTASFTPTDSATGTVEDSASWTDTDVGSESNIESDTPTATASEWEAATDVSTGTTTGDTDTPSVVDTDTPSVVDTDTPLDTATATATATVPDTDTCTAVPDTGPSVIGAIEDWGSFGYATVTLESVSGPGFDQAWRCERAGEAVDPAASQLYADTTEDIVAGDVLLATFWARCVSSVSGECRTGFIFEENVSPWTNGAEYYLVAGTEWSMHQVPFVAGVDFPAGTAHVTFRLGYDEQTIDIYCPEIINYGPDEALGCMPQSPGIFDSVAIISEPRLVAVADTETYGYRIEFNGRPEPEVTITGLPAWLEFDGRRVLSGVPSYTDIGLTDVIEITVQNENGSDSQSFQIDVIPDPDLVAHWPLDETGGTVANDASGRGHHGDLFGSPVWLPGGGQVGGGVRLDGYDGDEDYIEVANAADLEDVQEGDYTLVAWVAPRSVPAGTAENDNDFAYAVLIKEGDPLGLAYGNDERFVGTHVFDTDGPVQTFSGALAPAAYHHVAMRVNTSLGYTHLYVDGNYADGVNFTVGTPPLEYNQALWRIGVALPAAAEGGMVADIDVDDVRIYSRSLSQAEIRMLGGF